MKLERLKLLDACISGGPVDVAFTTRVEGGKTIADLTFSGTFVFGGSLVDGNYELLVLGAKVKTPAGAELDGDSNGTPGGNYSLEQVRSISSIVILAIPMAIEISRWLSSMS